MSELESSENFRRQVIAICVGIGLNIALIPLTFFLMAIGGRFLVGWIDVYWHPLVVFLIYYLAPGLGMVFSGFVTTHLAKRNIYRTCFFLSILAPIALLIAIQIMISIFLASPGFDWLSEPQILGFFLMHIPTMLLGGFLYKKYFQATTESNRLDSGLIDEYLD